MASTIKTSYGTNGQVITVTIAALGSGTARASTVVDNTTNLFLDALVQVTMKTGAASTVATGVINVYAYATTDNGTTYSEGATGTDAAITLTVPTNLILIGQINAVANAVTYKSSPFSVASAFGGVLPQKWGVVIENQCGGSLDGTAGNFLVEYQGIYTQTV